MSLIGVIQVTPGRVAEVHKVNQIEVNDADRVNVKVRLNHFATAADAQKGTLVWQTIYDLPKAALIEDLSDPINSAEKWLVANTEEYQSCVYSETLTGVETLEGVQASVLATVNAVYSSKVGALTQGYPSVEQSSWPFQVEEAKALEANPNYNPIWLTACAAERGLDETAAELGAKVLAINNPYRQAHGDLTGIRQRLERQILAESDIVVVKTIAWPSDGMAPAATPASAPAPVIPPAPTPVPPPVAPAA